MNSGGKVKFNEGSRSRDNHTLKGVELLASEKDG